MPVRAARAAVALAAAAAMLLASGCEVFESKEAREVERATKTSSAGATCAAKATAAPMPAGFPSAFRLPDSAIVTGSEKRSEGRLIVYAVTSQGVKETLAFLQKSLPEAGLRLSAGEVEEHDAESDWSGEGYRGRWAIRELPQCDGDTLITVLAAKAG